MDAFKLRSELVISSDDVDQTTPIGRYVASRPELSSPGTFIHADAAWQVTEVVALAGDVVHDLDEDRTATASAGVLLRHHPDLSTFAELRHIEVEDSTYFNVGMNYNIYEKYTLAARLSYDVVEERFQTAQADILRRYPSITLGVGVSHNQVNDETSFGFTIVPAGLSARGVQYRGGANAGGGIGG